MKYLKLFEEFNPDNILNATEQQVLSKECFDYLCALLGFVGRSAAGETKSLPNIAPIDSLINALMQYGRILGFQVNKFSKVNRMDFEYCLKNCYVYLKVIDKFVGFTEEEIDETPANFEKPEGYLKEELAKGFYTIQSVYDEFELIWSKRVGEAPPILGGGKSRSSDSPTWFY